VTPSPELPAERPLLPQLLLLLEEHPLAAKPWDMGEQEEEKEDIAGREALNAPPPVAERITEGIEDLMPAAAVSKGK
jgi:hypothetical protein